MGNKALIKGVVGFAVVGGGLLYFGMHAIQSSGSRDLIPAESIPTLQATGGLSVVGGVKPGSIRYDRESGQCTFILLGGEVEIPVQYLGRMPEGFSDRGEVVLQGWLDAEGVFQAQTLESRPSSERP